MGKSKIYLLYQNNILILVATSKNKIIRELKREINNGGILFKKEVRKEVRKEKSIEKNTSKLNNLVIPLNNKEDITEVNKLLKGGKIELVFDGVRIQ